MKCRNAAANSGLCRPDSMARDVFQTDPAQLLGLGKVNHRPMPAIYVSEKETFNPCRALSASTNSQADWPMQPHSATLSPCAR